MLEPGRGTPDPPADWGLPSSTGGRAVEHARRWAEGYGWAWRAGDAEAAASLYPPDAHYRSETFRDPHVGRDGVLAYTRLAYATETDQDPQLGTPFASGASAAVEWLVAIGRDYWFLEPGTHPRSRAGPLTSAEPAVS